MKKRTIITLAVGSQYFSRMALALMYSCRRFAGNKLDYIIFSDQEYLPYYQIPSWLQIRRVSIDDLNKKDLTQVKSRGWYLKSQLMMEPMLCDRTVLFLDADSWVFADQFDKIFDLIEKESVVIYGDYLREDVTWGEINFPQVAEKAGIKVKNMWLNGGVFGRASDPIGHSFARLYKELMEEYPFRPYIESNFWKAADEPYLATAYQLAHLENHLPAPEKIKSFSSDIYMTTYLATITDTHTDRPRVTTTYLDLHSHNPAIIHFLGGMRIPYYRKLVNSTARMTTTGKLLQPVFAMKFLLGRAKNLICRTLKISNLT